MSAMGQKRTLRRVCLMSALPPTADIPRRLLDVRKGQEQTSLDMQRPDAAPPASVSHIGSLCPVWDDR
jgi:hypothetical protein